MEQNELNRLRQQFEQLYQQPDLKISSVLDSSLHSPIEMKQDAAIEQSKGLWQTLQTVWQRISIFLTEEGNNSHPGEMTWWQMHPARTGSDMPVFFPGDSEQIKHWLERIYQVKSVRTDPRGQVGDR